MDINSIVQSFLNQYQSSHYEESKHFFKQHVKDHPLSDELNAHMNDLSPANQKVLKAIISFKKIDEFAYAIDNMEDKNTNFYNLVVEYMPMHVDTEKFVKGNRSAILVMLNEYCNSDDSFFHAEHAGELVNEFTKVVCKSLHMQPHYLDDYEIESLLSGRISKQIDKDSIQFAYDFIAWLAIYIALLGFYRSIHNERDEE